MRRWLLASGLLLLASCSSSPQTSPSGLPTGSPSPSASPPPGALSVSLTSPSVSTFHTNGKVTVQVVATGNPDRVSLTKNGAPLVDLVPPYTYVWDTTAEPEGSYELRAVTAAGAASATSDPRTIVVDRTPPTVLTRVPAAAAPDVDVHSSLRVAFSEPIAPGSLTDASLAVVDAQAHALGRTFDVDPAGTTVTAHLSSPLAAPATITVRLTDAITDLAGNALVVPADAWTLTYPEWLAMGAPLGKVGGQNLLFDKSGRAFVAWTEYRDANSGAVDRVSAWDGTKWSDLAGSPLNLQHYEYPATPPALSLDPAGSLVSQWHDGTGAHFVRWDGSGQTSLLGASPWSSLVAPRSFSWGGFDSGGGPIAVAPGLVRWDGAAWKSFGDETTIKGTPQLRFVDATGRAMTAAVDGYANYTALNSYTSTGTGWVQVGTSPSFTANTRLALLGTSWSELRLLAIGGGSGGGVSVSRWDDKYGWVQPNRAEAYVPDVASDPTATLGADGALYVAGVAYPVTGVVVRKWDGAAWQKLGNTPPLSRPAIALDASGVVYIAGQQPDSSLLVVRHNQ